MSSKDSPAGAAASFGVPDASLTIDEFCQAEKISRSMLYRAWSEGWGPKFYRVRCDAPHYLPGASGVAA